MKLVFVIRLLWPQHSLRWNKWMNNLIRLQIIKTLTTVIERVCGGCCACMLCHVRLFLSPWTIACQAPLSMPFPRKEYRSAISYPKGYGFFTSEPAGKPSDSIQWSRVFHKIFNGHCTGTWCERTLGSWPAWMMTASFQNPLSTYWVLVPSFLECFWKFLIPTIVWNLSFLREMGMYEFGKKGFRIIHYACNLFLPWCTLPPSVRVNS